MSGLNQKGPMGQGPMTGRKMGKCTNFGAGRNGSTINPEQEDTESLDQGMVRGMGFGCRKMGFRGMGRGMGAGGRGMGLMNQNRFRNGR